MDTQGLPNTKLRWARVANIHVADYLLMVAMGKVDYSKEGNRLYSSHTHEARRNRCSGSPAKRLV